MAGMRISMLAWQYFLEVGFISLASIGEVRQWSRTPKGCTNHTLILRDDANRLHTEIVRLSTKVRILALPSTVLARLRCGLFIHAHNSMRQPGSNEILALLLA